MPVVAVYPRRPRSGVLPLERPDDGTQEHRLCGTQLKLTGQSAPHPGCPPAATTVQGKPVSQ